jgi:hypothetical protein
MMKTTLEELILRSASLTLMLYMRKCDPISCLSVDSGGRFWTGFGSSRGIKIHNGVGLEALCMPLEQVPTFLPVSPYIATLKAQRVVRSACNIPSLTRGGKLQGGGSGAVGQQPLVPRRCSRHQPWPQAMPDRTSPRVLGTRVLSQLPAVCTV